jgi:hypothetical protein
MGFGFSFRNLDLMHFTLNFVGHMVSSGAARSMYSEQDTFLKPDIGSGFGKNIAQAPGRPCWKSLIAQWICQVLSCYAYCLSLERDEAQSVARVTPDFGPGRVDDPCCLGSVPDLNVNPCQLRVGHQEQVSDAHIQTTTKRSQYDDLLCAVTNCIKKGKFEIGFIFFGRRSLDLDVLFGEGSLPPLAQGVKIPDDSMEMQTECFSVEASTVGSDDICPYPFF